MPRLTRAYRRQRALRQRQGRTFVQRLQCLAKDDPGFRRWLQEGVDQLEAGQYDVLVLSSDGTRLIPEEQEG